MKKLLVSLVIGLSLVLCSSVSAEILTFEWNQADLTNLKEWKLFWGDASGGPYTELSVIAYDESPGPIYSSPADAPVTGDQGTTVTKYFVLIACGDVPQEGGGAEYKPWLLDSSRHVLCTIQLSDCGSTIRRLR